MLSAAGVSPLLEAGVSLDGVRVELHVVPSVPEPSAHGAEPLLAEEVRAEDLDEERPLEAEGFELTRDEAEPELVAPIAELAPDAQVVPVEAPGDRGRRAPRPPRRSP